MAFEQFLNMERLCTIKEIADRAGVGQATVHRVLKGSPSVSQKTAARVILALDSLNSLKVERVHSLGSWPKERITP